MAKGSRLDSTFTESRGLSNLALPYECISVARSFTDTDDNDHRILGDNSTTGSAEMYVTAAGRIARRPIFNTYLTGTGAGTIISGRRIDRTFYYETLPDSAGVVYSYILISAYNHATSLWELYYRPNQGGSTVPTIFTNTRSCNSSRAAHIFAVSRGLAYIKGFPHSSTGELLGTIIFDGSGGTAAFKPWGVLPPTTPMRVEGWVGKLTAPITATATSATVSANSAPPATPFPVQIENEQCNCTATAGAGPYTLTLTRAYNGTTGAEHAALLPVLHRSWAASAHKVEVNSGWQYVYCKKTITGHISSRSPLETNPDLLPSNTLPFFDQIPDMTYEGDADTTNIPKFVFYRTNDGGGTFLELEEITNPGSGARVYTDDSLASGTGSTFSDPIPDKDLPTALVAPSPDSNNPPPTVNSPLVVGVDVPSLNTSNMETWQGRIWYAIDNILYCSNNEETKAGIPEEAWEYGDNATLYVFPDRIISIRATSSALYAMGARNTYIGTGTDKLSFAFNIISTSTPAFLDQDSSVAFLNRVAFVTRDLRVCVITGESVDVVTEPIGSIPIVNTLAVKLAFYFSPLNQWLMVMIPNHGPLTNTGQIFVYDFGRSQREGRDFWFPPWSHRLGAFCIAPVGSAGAVILFGGVINSVGATKSSGLVQMAFDASGPDSSLDDAGAWSTRSFEWGAIIGPYKNPAGNHLNSKSVPHTTTAINYVKLDYSTSASASTNIGLKLGIDQNTVVSSTVDITTLQTLSTRRAASTGYTSKEWRPWQVGDDFAVHVSRGDIAADTGVTLERLVVGFLPSGGPDAAGQG